VSSDLESKTTQLSDKISPNSCLISGAKISASDPKTIQIKYEDTGAKSQQIDDLDKKLDELNKTFQEAKKSLDELINLKLRPTDFAQKVDDITQNIQKSPWKIETKSFVASSLDELTPTNIVKVDEQYSITATITRPSGIADYPPLLYYVMYIQVLDQNGDRVTGSWHQDTIRVNQTASAGTYWSPTNIGNYTVEVFVWASFGGTPLAEPTKINVDVV